MGLSPFKPSNSFFDNKEPSWIEKIFNKKTDLDQNPDPSRYVIHRHEIINEYLIIEIKYLDCTNYEGIKILVFDKGTTVSTLLKQKLVDPHFSENKEQISPIARFEPTLRGWEYAQTLCKNLK